MQGTGDWGELILTPEYSLSFLISGIYLFTYFLQIAEYRKNKELSFWQSFCSIFSIDPSIWIDYNDEDWYSRTNSVFYFHRKAERKQKDSCSNVIFIWDKKGLIAF